MRLYRHRIDLPGERGVARIARAGLTIFLHGYIAATRNSFALLSVRRYPERKYREQHRRQ
jgi:hypothetical protein